MKTGSSRTPWSLSILVGSLIAAHAMGCIGETATTGDEEDVKKAKPGAQMNDVSVLYPLAKTQAEFDHGYLPASAKGQGGALLPVALYEAAGFVSPKQNGPLPPGADAALAYTELRAVAFRIDPCFANIGP